MKRKIKHDEMTVYIKDFVWTMLAIMWLYIDYKSGGGMLVTTLFLGISALLILIGKFAYCKYKGEKPRLFLSDSNNAVILFVVGLGSIIGGDNVEYIFLAIVAVVGVCFDAYDRHMENVDETHME